MINRKILYVQIYKGHLICRMVDTSHAVRLDCDGLLHPRTLAGDFWKLEKSLKRAFNEFLPPVMRLIKPFVLIHLMPEVEGGYTSMELRFFREAALSAGAKLVYMCDNRVGELSEQQVRDAFSDQTRLF